MRIAVMSDTHLSKYNIKKACSSLKKVDAIIHLGDNVQDVEEIKKYYDGEIINIKGNCDFAKMPSEKTFIMGGKKFFITHGDKYGVKYDTFKLGYKAKEIGADIVCFGHTHVPYIELEDGVWYINPGSVSYSRSGSNSFAYVEISDGKVHPVINNL